jgi:hypothetical protein
MPTLNPDKSYSYVPPPPPVLEEKAIPENWLEQLGNRSSEALQLSEADKAQFLGHIQRHVGVNSTYALASALQDSLKAIYIKLSAPTLSSDKKTAIAFKLHEGAANCTPGFHDRANETVNGFVRPKNLSEVLMHIRQEIVNKVASQNTDEVHAHNRFFVIARIMGYGVQPINPEDIYSGNISDETIKEKLNAAFQKEYQFFSLLNAMQSSLSSLLSEDGYTGKKANGEYVSGEYSKFSEPLKPFVTIEDADLYVMDEDDHIIDINWPNIKTALLKKFKEENYFTLTREEERELNLLSLDDTKKEEKVAEEKERPKSTLFATDNEFLQCVTYFKDATHKQGLALLIQHKLASESLDDKKKTLGLLKKIPELSDLREFQQFYINLAAEEGNSREVFKKIQAWSALGCDLDPVLPLLVSEKKGRRLLLQNEQIQNLFPKTEVNGKAIEAWLQQAREEKVSFAIVGLFAHQTPSDAEIEAAEELLEHVLKGEEAKAKTIIAANPKLLFIEADAQDFSGRTIIGSAFQAALGAEDVEMCEMMLPYIDELKGGQDEKRRQYQEQFPQDYQKEEKEKTAEDLKALHKVVNAIGESKDNAGCESALEEFQNYLKPKGVIKTGKHFNVALLVEAFKLYDEKYDAFGGTWDSPKNILFWRKVIGQIQRYLPACYAQAFCQGVGSIVEDGEKLKRDLKFCYGGGFFYPLDGDPGFRLGVDYAARSQAARHGSADCGATVGGGHHVVKLYGAKTAALRKLMQRPDDQSKKRCSIM